MLRMNKALLKKIITLISCLGNETSFPGFRDLGKLIRTETPDVISIQAPIPLPQKKSFAKAENSDIKFNQTRDRLSSMLLTDKFYRYGIPQKPTLLNSHPSILLIQKEKKNRKTEKERIITKSKDLHLNVSGFLISSGKYLYG